MYLVTAETKGQWNMTMNWLEKDLECSAKDFGFLFFFFKREGTCTWGSGEGAKGEGEKES